jgi:8-oxo-dGTP pyrophosphatase MutT (NUDIX family)
MSNDLRQHKDNKPLRRICARVICCKDGNVLVIKRHKYGEDYYVLPGGGIDPQETDFVAAERELLEETGVTAKALDLLTILPGSEKHSEQRVILCEYISGEPHLPPDSEEAGRTDDGQNTYEPQWMSIKDAKRLIVPRELGDYL